MPVKIDPTRFIGKAIVRRLTAIDRADDYVLLIDTVHVGRIIRRRLARPGEEWFWTITGPYLPALQRPGSGGAPTLDAAQEAFTTKFWSWHAWALLREERPKSGEKAVKTKLTARHRARE
jgi:hypothetical protein